SDLASASLTVIASVADAPLTGSLGNIQTVEGQSFTGTLATFSDADPAGSLGDYTATVAWGDGHTTSGTVQAASGAFAVVDATGHVYDEEGTYTLTLTVTDHGAPLMLQGQVVVSDAGLSPGTGGSLSALAGTTLSGT